MKDTTTLMLAALQKVIPAIGLLNINERENVQKQPERLALFSADVDILMKRYHAEKSYLGQACDWYHALTQWEKIKSSVIILASSSVVGLILGIGLLLPLAIGLSLLFMHQVITNYQTTEKKRSQRFCEDLINCEKTMNEAMSALYETQEKIKQLGQTHQELIHASAQVSEQIRLLAEEVMTLQKTSLNLTQTGENITAHSQVLSRAGTTFTECLNQAELALAHEVEGLKANNAADSQAHLTLSMSVSSLTSITASFDKQMTSVSEIITTLAHHSLPTIKTAREQSVINSEGFQATLTESEQVMKETRQLSAEVDEFILTLNRDFAAVQQQVSHFLQARANESSPLARAG